MMRLLFGLVRCISVCCVAGTLSASEFNTAREREATARGPEVEVVLSNASVTAKLKVPIDLIGPDFLALSKSAITGNELALLPLELPVAGLIPCASGKFSFGKTDIDTALVFVRPAISNSIRRFLEMKWDKPWGYLETGETVHGLKKLSVSGNVEKGVIPYLSLDARDPEQDTLIRCLRDTCRYLIEIKGNVNLEIHGVPDGLLHHWADIVANARAQVEPMVLASGLKEKN